MMKTALRSLMIAALAACGGSKPAATTPTLPPTASAETPAPAGAMLTLGELKFYEGEEEGLALHADGRLEVKMKHSEAGKPTEEKWQEIVTLTADGKIKAGGKVVAHLEPDGTLKSEDGQTAPFKLDGEALVVGDKRITLDDKGVLQGGEPSTNVHVTGLTDAGSRRAALLALALVLASAQPEPTATGPAATTPATSPAPAPAPAPPAP